MTNSLLEQLEHGSEYFFRDWPNVSVPAVAAGVYTIWQNTRLVYAGMAGRAHTAESLAQVATSAKTTGLRSRLASHASGRRSGDQFCVYVADRFVLPTLQQEELHAIAAGTLSFDSLVRAYIHRELSYRYAIAASGSQASQLERTVRQGGLSGQLPILNPLGSNAKKP